MREGPTESLGADILPLADGLTGFPATGVDQPSLDDHTGNAGEEPAFAELRPPVIQKNLDRTILSVFMGSDSSTVQRLKR